MVRMCEAVAEFRAMLLSIIRLVLWLKFRTSRADMSRPFTVNRSKLIVLAWCDQNQVQPR